MKADKVVRDCCEIHKAADIMEMEFTEEESRRLLVRFWTTREALRWALREGDASLVSEDKRVEACRLAGIDPETLEAHDE